MEVSKAKELISKFEDRIADRGIVAFGPSGSRMYGLHHEDSDYDWFVMVGKVGSKNEIHDQSEEDDVWITDAEKFVKNISKASPNYVDFMLSNKTHWNVASPLYPYAKSVPADFIKYANNLGRHIKNDIHHLVERTTFHSERDYKMMKTAVRNAFQKYRAENSFTKPFKVQYDEWEKEALMRTYYEFLFIMTAFPNIPADHLIKWLDDKAKEILQ